MRAPIVTKRGGLVLLAVLATVGLVSTAVYAAQAKPDFALQSAPTSQSVQQGGEAAYALTINGSGGFTGAVALTSTVAPAGPSATLAPVKVDLTSAAPSGSSSLKVTTAASTPGGTYMITVTGTSGSTRHTVDVTLNVSATNQKRFTLAATPTSVTVAAGSSAVYTLAITRSPGFTGAVSLAGYGNYPTGTAAVFTPNPATGTSSSLQVSTDASTTPTGTYTLYVVGSASVDGKVLYQYAQTQLVVSAPAPAGQPFTISGDLAGQLAPGVPAKPLNLVLSNPNKKSLSITGLTVVISQVLQTSTAKGLCSVKDYSVTQYTGPYPLTMGSGTTKSLKDLGVGSDAWPKLQMLNTNVSQDGCKGATLTLAYSGSGQGN